MSAVESSCSFHSGYPKDSTNSCAWNQLNGQSYTIPCRECNLNTAFCTAGNPCPNQLKDIPYTVTMGGCGNSAPGCGCIAQYDEVWNRYTGSSNLATGNPCSPGFHATYCTLLQPATQHILDCCFGNVAASDEARFCGGLYCNSTCRESEVVKNYCSKCDNILTAGCQIYCPVGNPDDRASWCDDAMQNFCRTSVFAVGQDVCGCYNSPLNGLPNLPQGSPFCFDPICVVNGYKTKAGQALAENCKTTICTVAVECVNAGTCSIIDNEVTQVCGGSNGDGTSFFNRIILGLPVWVWLIIISALALIIILSLAYFNRDLI